MKKYNTVAVVTLLMLFPSYAVQPGQALSAPVEITAERIDNFESGLVRADTHVKIFYRDICIYCDHAEYNSNTRDVLLLGNIRLCSPGGITTGQRALYHIPSGQMRALNVSAVYYPMLLRALSFRMLSPHEYHVQYASLTTDDQLHPGYYIKSKAAHIYKDKNDRMVLLFPTFYLGKVPILWLPYFQANLNKNEVQVLPGYDRYCGAFLLTAYSFVYQWLDSSSTLVVHADYRTRHGAAFGCDSTIRVGKNKNNQGNITSYWAHGNRSTLGPTNYNRYRISYNQRLDCTESIYASCDLNILSDHKFMQDFYAAESRANPRLDNNISLTKRGKNYTLNLLSRFHVNAFSTVVKRLPELALEIKQHSLFGGPFHLDGVWTFGQLERSLGKKLRSSKIKHEPFQERKRLHLAINPPNYHCSALRLGSFVQLSVPNTYFGWINVIPHAGLHLTLYRYRKSSWFERKAISNNGKEKNFFQQSMGASNVIFRPSINYGIESSFKVFRTYRLQARFLGLNGLMHVMQPYISYSVVQRLWKQQRFICQFDTIQQTTQPLSINFPDFQATDAIDSWSILRTGIRHNFTTRRDNKNHRWLSINTFFDYNLSNPYFLAKVGNLSNLLTCYPSRWLTVSCDLQTPLDRAGFKQLDLSFSLMPIHNFQFSISYCYLTKHLIDNLLYGVPKALCNDVSQMTVDAYYRLNDNWSISSREQYDAHRKFLLYQRYLIHRDLSSWIASVGMDIRRHYGQKLHTGLVLVMTLKAAPKVVIPLLWDARRPLWPDENL